MPKMYLAISQIFYNIDAKEDYKLEDFTNTITEIIESVSKDNEFERWQVETVTRPIINIFNDFQGKICLALNFGLRVWCYDNYAKYELEFSQQLGNNVRPLVEDLYGGYLRIIGRCDDHSYVQNYLMEQFKVPILINGSTPHNDYTWIKFDIKRRNEGSIGKYALFRMFPEEMITLPSKDK